MFCCYGAWATRLISAGFIHSAISNENIRQIAASMKTDVNNPSLKGTHTRVGPKYAKFQRTMQSHRFRRGVIMRALSLSVVSILFPPLAFADTPFPVADYVVELNEDVGGADRATYANDWWQWAASMPGSESPVQDVIGTKCAVNQRGPVWYLAGGFGTSLISRTCTIPKDQHIFFPIINMLAYPPRGSTFTCDAVKAMAAQNNARYVYVRVYLDGSEVQNAERFRVASLDCFDLMGRWPASAGAPIVAPAATDGYWIMLRPLPPGQHRLEFRALYTNPDQDLGDTVQNISYDLTIAEN
jgi:hypothetical protein